MLIKQASCCSHVQALAADGRSLPADAFQEGVVQDEVSGLASWLQPQLSTLRTLQHVPGAAWKAALCTGVPCLPMPSLQQPGVLFSCTVSTLVCCMDLICTEDQTRPEQYKVLWGPRGGLYFERCCDLQGRLSVQRTLR